MVAPDNRPVKYPVFPVRKSRFPAPPGGDYAYVAAAEKIRTSEYQNSSVFDRQEVILGVLSTPDT